VIEIKAELDAIVEDVFASLPRAEERWKDRQLPDRCEGARAH
jgi:hypothetical protein